MGLAAAVVGSPQQRCLSVSPSAPPLPSSSFLSSSPAYGSHLLSTSPGKTMPTTHSFASDPKYAAPKVIQAQGRDQAKGPCILPIVRDGRKVSSTHYYLLPERPPYLDRYARFFREAEASPGGPCGGGEERRQANTATVRPMVVNLPHGNQSQNQGSHAQGQRGPAGELKANFSSNNNSSLGGGGGGGGGGCVKPGMKTSLSLPRVSSDGLAALSAPPSRTEGPATNTADRVKMVQEAVHGVTIEECQTALQNHNWNVQKAVHYLKVEQLFCLGLRPRAECLKILEMFDWNLEVASTQLLESYGSTSVRHRR